MVSTWENKKKSLNFSSKKIKKNKNLNSKIKMPKGNIKNKTSVKSDDKAFVKLKQLYKELETTEETFFLQQKILLKNYFTAFGKYKKFNKKDEAIINNAMKQTYALMTNSKDLIKAVKSINSCLSKIPIDASKLNKRIGHFQKVMVHNAKAFPQSAVQYQVIGDMLKKYSKKDDVFRRIAVNVLNKLKVEKNEKFDILAKKIITKLGVKVIDINGLLKRIKDKINPKRSISRSRKKSEKIKKIAIAEKDFSKIVAGVTDGLKDEKPLALDFGGAWITPVQRFPRYRMLLEDICKYANRTDLGESTKNAMNSIKTVIVKNAKFINESNIGEDFRSELNDLKALATEKRGIFSSMFSRLDVNYTKRIVSRAAKILFKDKPKDTEHKVLEALDIIKMNKKALQIIALEAIKTIEKLPLDVNQDKKMEYLLVKINHIKGLKGALKVLEKLQTKNGKLLPKLEKNSSLGILKLANFLNRFKISVENKKSAKKDMLAYEKPKQAKQRSNK